MKKTGLILDNDFYSLFYNILNKIKIVDKKLLSGGKFLKDYGDVNSEKLIDYIKLIEPKTKKILKFTNNIKNININKKISNFFKILENIFKLENKNYNEKISSFFTTNIIINNKDNYFIKYFVRLLKRYNYDNNITISNNIINLQNTQQNFFNKIFSNHLDKYLQKDNYDISKVIKNINDFSIFLNKNNLVEIKIGIYLKIISEIFLSKFFKSDTTEKNRSFSVDSSLFSGERSSKENTENTDNNKTKIIFYIIIILGIIVIKDFFIFFKKRSNLTKNNILILFILLLFILSLVDII